MTPLLNDGVLLEKTKCVEGLRYLMHYTAQRDGDMLRVHVTFRQRASGGL